MGANLQRRKGVLRRMKKLRQRARKALGRCVLLVQELGAWSDDFELGGCTVHVKTNGSAAVVVPNELESAGTLDSRLEHRWALVRVGETVLGSVHLPPVKSTS